MLVAEEGGHEHDPRAVSQDGSAVHGPGRGAPVLDRLGTWDEPPATRDVALRAGLSHPRRWQILAVLSLVQLMVVLDTTVSNIALPYAQAALGFSDGDRQWVVTAYSLAFGSLLLVGGRICDLIGRERALVVGLVGFAAASALGGAAVNFEMLVVARAAQGAFSALLAPAALALVSTTFESSGERARAVGIYGGAAAAGASIGLLAGGFVTEYLSWRWTLYVNDLIAVVALAGVLGLLRGRSTENRPRIDAVGTVLVSAGLFAVVYGFGSAARRPGADGWTEASTVSYLIIGAILITAFLGYERRAVHPLLPLRILLDRDRGGAYAALLLIAVGSYAVFLFLAYYLTATLGMSAVMTGLAFLPMTGMILVAAAVGNTLLGPRVSPRTLAPTGLLIAAIGLVMLTQISSQSYYALSVLPGTSVFGTGLGIVFASAFALGTLGVDPDEAGIAAATLNVANQVGGAVGTALLNTIATSVAASHVAAHIGALPVNKGVVHGI
ncbi:hypothetical protein CC117_33145 [Parafrankia colletiae]|uniref:Major facilitator superfamily (MFS) profile domain-containing protein n=2 Tax=Parafrankia colletiae TaxID=573497 RepID=A0A1S1R9M0_9ACTN|nr:hypothetical protein CC117_33145 [Parafrankia colletiae]